MHQASHDETAIGAVSRTPVGNLNFGTANRAMATLVERHSRFVMLVGLPNGHTADVVAEALSAKITDLPDQRRATSPAWTAPD